MTASHGQTWPSQTDFPDLSDVSVIARGAHATVYGAFQISAGRKVALKIDNRALAPDSDDRRRFQQEARAVGQLSEHPGIIDTYIAGFTSQGNPYMVTELCNGSYADKIAEYGPLQPNEVQTIGVRIADALSEAHGHRVLHRDIKPANILIDGSGEPVLADFGVASLMDSRVGQPVVRAAMTPAYAPMETFKLRPSGEPGDVYSLSATLYALLSGRPPRFPIDDRNFTIDDVIGLFSDPIGDIAGVSQTMLSMLRAAMTNNPEGRPSAAQFRDMLDSVPIAAATGAMPAVTGPIVTPVATPSSPTASATQQPVSPAAPSPYEQPSPPRHVSPPPSPYEQPSPPRHVSPSPSPYEQPSPPRDVVPIAPFSSGPPTPPPAPPAQRRPEWGEPVAPTPERKPSPGPRHATWGLASSSPAPEPRQSSDNLPVPLGGSGDLTTRRERRIAARGGKETSGMGSLILVGAIAVAIIVTGAVFAILAFSGEDPEPSDDAAGNSATCDMDKFDLGCVDPPVCFNGSLTDDEDFAAAKEVSCEKEHDWEAYAKGKLSGGVDSPTYAAVSSDKLVKDTCLNEGSKGPLTSITGMGASKWNSKVLPPTEKDFKGGSKTFYCVATSKDGKASSGSQLS